MTPLQWFDAYKSAVDYTAHLTMCSTPLQADRYAARTLVAYESVKGAEYAREVQRQAGLLVDGMRAMQKGEVP